MRLNKSLMLTSASHIAAARAWQPREQTRPRRHSVRGLLRLTRLPRPAQGDLPNPAYFDFISFAQLGTVSAALDRPRSVFQARPLATSKWVKSEDGGGSNHRSSACLGRRTRLLHALPRACPARTLRVRVHAGRDAR